eukprot:TRINITY_DN17543_c0_g1_i2.p1 TRINITY_DN17543_c0_g1~~TRINITY_DN17543_c0_g1_i2.p1  ORF type:complete len:761 (+),score=155.48 TRINITY_DN17543_c0_g1_i2:80-2362(+)
MARSTVLRFVLPCLALVWLIVGRIRPCRRLSGFAVVHGSTRVVNTAETAGRTLRSNQLLDKLNDYAEYGDVAGVESMIAPLEESGATADKKLRRVVWNTVLKGCSNAGDHERAAKHYLAMLSKGIIPNQRTFGKLMAGAAKLGNLTVAERWFEELQRVCRGKANDVHYATLIDAAGKSGNVTGAEEWFQRSLEAGMQPAIQTFNALINGAAASGDAVRAEGWLRRMVDAGIEPSRKTYGSLATGAARAGNVTGAEYWMRRCEEAGVIVDPGFYVSRIDAAAVAQDLPQALELYKQAREKLGSDCPLTVFNVAIKACSRVGDIAAAEEIMEDIRKFGLRPDVLSYSGLMKSGSVLGSQVRTEYWAQEALKAKAVDVISLTMLLRCVGADTEKVEEWLERFAAVGVTPNSYAFSTLAKSAAEEGDIDAAEKWLRQGLTKGLKISTEDLSRFFSQGCKADKFLRSERVLQSIMADHRVAVDAAMCECVAVEAAKAGKFEIAEEWLRRCQQAGLTPAAKKVGFVLTLVSKSGDLAATERWLALAQELGAHDARMTSDLLRAIGDQGDVERLQRVVAEGAALPGGLSKISYDVAMRAYSNNGRMDLAVQTFSDMVDAGHRPCLKSFSAIIGGFIKGGDDASTKVWLQYMKDCSVEPDAIFYTVVIRDCRRNMDMAEELFREMIDAGIRVDPPCMHTIVGVLGKQRFRALMERLGVSEKDVVEIRKEAKTAVHRKRHVARRTRLTKAAYEATEQPPSRAERVGRAT